MNYLHKQLVVVLVLVVISGKVECASFPSIIKLSLCERSGEMFLCKQCNLPD